LEKQNFFSAAELDRLFSQCLDALHYMAARKSLYHRDIKPENILLDVAGDVKITDFGCSKKLADSKMAAMTLVGTPYFLSPKLWEAYCAQQ
jgi:serine/threonine protein kinase